MQNKQAFYGFCYRNCQKIMQLDQNSFNFPRRSSFDSWIERCCCLNRNDKSYLNQMIILINLVTNCFEEEYSAWVLDGFKKINCFYYYDCYLHDCVNLLELTITGCCSLPIWYVFCYLIEKILKMREFLLCLAHQD